MQVWSVNAANARFSEFLDACLSNGPQMVTVRGVETAVLVSVSEWRRLQQGTGPSLKEFLLSSQARAETITATRGIVKRRDL